MYIARDKDGDLYLYKKQPVKYSESWQYETSIYFFGKN